MRPTPMRLQQTNYVSSVEIRPEWAVVEQIPFASLAKLSCSVGEAEDVAKCGELEYYDKVGGGGGGECPGGVTEG